MRLLSYGAMLIHGMALTWMSPHSRPWRLLFFSGVQGVSAGEGVGGVGMFRRTKGWSEEGEQSSSDVKPRTRHCRGTSAGWCEVGWLGVAKGGVGWGGVGWGGPGRGEVGWGEVGWGGVAWGGMGWGGVGWRCGMCTRYELVSIQQECHVSFESNPNIMARRGTSVAPLSRNRLPLRRFGCIVIVPCRDAGLQNRHGMPRFLTLGTKRTVRSIRPENSISDGGSCIVRGLQALVRSGSSLLCSQINNSEAPRVHS